MDTAGFFEKLLTGSSGRDKTLKVLQNISRIIRYNLKEKDSTTYHRLTSFIRNISNSRKCFNVMMTVLDYVSLKEILYKPKRGESVDYYIMLAKRVIMLIFWTLDLLILCHRTGIFRGNTNYLLKPQMNIYVVNLILSSILQVRRYLAADNTMKASKVAEEVMAAMKKKKEVYISMGKICCDMLSALDASGLLRITFGISINEALISVASLISAFISLRSIFMS